MRTVNERALERAIRRHRLWAEWWGDKCNYPTNEPPWRKIGVSYVEWHALSFHTQSDEFVHLVC
jgi:hypothetical protein